MGFVHMSLPALAFITYRVLSTFIVNTFFVPDEYWQSLEVAHKLVFGYGYLTWEWKAAIRSFFYPSWIALMYYILQVFKFDNVYTITILPRIAQSILYGIGDFFIYKLSSTLFGHRAAMWTIFCLLTAWFPFYCASRTLTNTTEAALSACVYYLYPWKKRSLKRRVWSYLWVMSATCLVRPTSAVLWVPLCVWHLCRIKVDESLKQALRILIVGITSCGLQCLVDYFGYGFWTFTPLRFLQLNWFQDIGAFYGTHSAYWYFAVGFPVVVTIHVVPIVLGAKVQMLRPFLNIVTWQIIVLSCLRHKEFRFLLPIVPLALCISGVSIEATLRGIKSMQRRLYIKSFVIIAILVVNIPLMVYMSVYHQRGTLEVMKFIAEKSQERNKIISVMFLMPCHSTPFYSFVHRNIPMDFLTCEPNLNNIPNYKDEADVFYEDPESWLSNAVNKSTDLHHFPSTHIVMFNNLYPLISNFLAKWHYKLCFETFHTDFPTDRVGHYVQVYCLNS